MSVAVSARLRTHKSQRLLRLDQLHRWDLSVDDLAKDAVSVVRHDSGLLEQSGCRTKNLVVKAEAKCRTSPRRPCIGSVTCKTLGRLMRHAASVHGPCSVLDAHDAHTAQRAGQ